MKVILFGATGMIGQGVLRECLLDPEVEAVLAVGRRPTGRSHPKLRECLHPDMAELGPIEAELAGYDAALFCLGISSVGLSEERYTAVTYTLTLAAARTLLRRNPGMAFIYVSAEGSDGTERGPMMWARVRGRTENDLFRLPFARVHVVRPAGIRPMHGIRSRTPFVTWFYRLLAPVLPLLHRLFPAYMTSTEELGRAMLALAKGTGPAAGAPPVIGSRAIAGLAGAGQARQG
jgi:uncharacterized protein YbjT (DUF2867 family)